MPKTLIVFLVLSFSLPVLAFDYELKGSYKLDSSILKSIQYTINWSEEKGKIKGEYVDNHFSGKAPVSGETSNVGRTFNVTLDKSVHGVKSITVLAARTPEKDTGTTVPVGIVTRDEKGAPLTTTDSYSQFIVKSSLAQREEERPCTAGFGEVKGYCGLYKGLIAEDEDRHDMCDLLLADATRFELNEAAEFRLYFGEVHELIDTPNHLIGRLPRNPASTTIDVESRHCSALSQTDFPSRNCKRLILTGTFSTEGNIRTFSGTYTIRDEKTEYQCRYSLAMEQR